LTINGRRSANYSEQYLECACDVSAASITRHSLALSPSSCGGRMLRASARCTNCGGKGATLQRPGWAGNHIGFYPFPMSIADDNA
jgi:hypothetical protein